jgi:hypothetical protein
MTPLEENAAASALANANIIGRLQGLTRTQRLLLGLGGVTALFLFLNRRQVMTQAGAAFDFAKRTAFKVALPSAVGMYSDQILNAAQKYNVDPWVLAGIMYNESRGGIAVGYKPQGPAGTGDFIPRWQGNLYFKFANPATGLPPDGEGWGRGLMQIDYGAHNDWVTKNNWRDAQTNINKGAEIFKWNLDYFSKPSTGIIEVENWRVENGKPEYNIQPWKVKYPRAAWPTLVKDPRPLSGSQLYEAAIAAYNVSPKAVLQAVGLGLPAEAGTTRQEYVTKFLAVIAPWKAKFV